MTELSEDGVAGASGTSDETMVHERAWRDLMKIQTRKCSSWQVCEVPKEMSPEKAWLLVESLCDRAMVWARVRLRLAI